MAKITQVEVERTTSRAIVARIGDGGEFVFSGHEILEAQDIGDPAEHYVGDLKYARTVPGDHKDTMLLWLVQEHFKTDAELDAWLISKSIPSEFHNVD